MIRSLLAVVLFASMNVALAGPEPMSLYEGRIPGALDAPDRESVRDASDPHLFIMNTSRPTLAAYLPKKPDASRAAVIVLPGGGYRGVSIVKEGDAVAKAFNDMGIAAFVVKYRTPDMEQMRDRTTGPLQDAQQAIRLVRERATEWNIDPSRIGLMGFSAGGHLASTAATHYDKPVLSEWRGSNLRPDFLMLIYPVISFDEAIAHMGSREQLVGKTPSPQLVAEYSNELHVTAVTPPTFIVHAADDGGVPVANSIRFFEALQKNKVPVELIVYPAGGHGFGLNNATTPDRWIERCRDWLVSQKLLSAPGDRQ